ncbi:MAG: HNH endonuclease [Nitrospirota bacterium]|nr:HNH endonuclease [Nitrospirota bacterium]
MKRNMIFESNKRSRSRSWIEMLGLPVRRETEPQVPPPRSRPACEACSEGSVPLERAHWKEARGGGQASADNIVLLCPNCHTKLDRGADHAFTEKVRAILLHRVVSKHLTKCRPEQLLLLCQQILGVRSGK